MVRPLICCMGTRGDVQPFIALSLGLLAADDQPLLLVPPEYLSYVAEYDVPVQSYTKSMQVCGANAVPVMRTNTVLYCAHTWYSIPIPRCNQPICPQKVSALTTEDGQTLQQGDTAYEQANLEATTGQLFQPLFKTWCVCV